MKEEMCIGELRKMSVAQIAKSLHKKCDPDVAIIAAWWVNHNCPPKNWSALRSRTENAMAKIQPSEMPERFIGYIMMNYEANKVFGKNQSLL